ncbi:MAG: Mov34/MPN/PAD-1 family protein [Kofleriaceae bacterium]|nr:Mov34/MPN/PAD-1 family protein [Kofleriaceae bacterium]
MSGKSPVPVRIDPSLLRAVYQEARKSFPAECCGWLAGARDEHKATRLRSCVNAQSGGEHPTQSGRGADTAYVIDGEDLLALSRELDGLEPAKLIYHSHYNGRAYFSQTDHEVATSPWGDGPMYPVQQLVVGLTADRVVEAALFAWSDSEEGFVEIQRFAGADL